jgi:hypothetical protein
MMKVSNPLPAPGSAPETHDAMSQAHVQVILAGDVLPAPLEVALRRAAAVTSFRPLADAIRRGAADTVDAYVVVVPPDQAAIATDLRALLARLGTVPRPTLVLRADGQPVSRVPHPLELPVSFGSALDIGELTARLRTMLDMRHALPRAGEAEARIEQRVTEQFAGPLRLASQIQRQLMPQTLPPIEPFTFAVLFRPVDFVSGDIFDVQRLDDDHVGLALVDAAGHGIPAALLTVLIKRALRGQAPRDGRPAILPPTEVLRQLNADILGASLAECRFVAACYALANTRTRTITVARGGVPYPLLRRADGTITLIRPAGGIVGVLPEAEFGCETYTLDPGDTVLFYSDGLDALLAPPVAERAIARARRAAAVPQFADSGGGAAPPGDEEITQTSWFETLRRDGLTAALDELAARHETLRRLGHPLDDLTVLAVHCAG